MIIDEIVLATDPALRKIEAILLWKNKFKTVLLFSLFHFVFWLYFMYNIRTYCMIFMACLIFHLLDAYRDKKRRYIMKIRNQSQNLDENICSLGRYIIWTFTKACTLRTKVNRLKSKNRLQYFLLMFIFWSGMLVVSIKIKSSHLAYILFWIIFFLPAFIHYQVAKKILFVLLPLLQQLDQSMQYERRSVLDKSELLVDVKLPKAEYDDDYEEEAEFFKQLSEKEKRVLENFEDEDEEMDEYVDHEDIEIQEEIDERYIDHENLENVQRIHTIEYRVKLSPKNFINKVEESLYDDSLLPNESLPNIDSSSDTESSSNTQENFLGKRRVKNRPSLREYYGDKIDMRDGYESRAETYMVKGSLLETGTVKMRSSKQEHDQDIDETFDFLDEEY
ncbi:hypothetical protein BpHYR1_025476 [Brachionus plicatilis]|uniref:RETREG1-3/ARL6IP-like N-terminal reticulon-homology domain-containing protein n=1 Tax=Brachionus plicatilis TaxID=10195 RepID=A0A3M7PB26_BRAPC|nr:hypothetical protein BpHYR1_025476 [Brachionus plicatilis]